MKNLETNALSVLRVNITRRDSMGFFDFLKGKSKEEIELEELRSKLSSKLCLVRADFKAEGRLRVDGCR